jgi:type IV secretion system protein TrbL
VAVGGGTGGLMLDWAIDGLGSLLGFGAGAVAEAAGWTWDAVVEGFYRWLANGMALIMEWVWSILDAGTTPRLTEDWFQNELAARVGVIGLAMVIAMMLASAIQAALAGRPEQIGDAVKQGVRAIVATALTVSAVDVLIGVTDEAAAAVWDIGREDLVTTMERIAAVATTNPHLGVNVIGPACLMLGLLSLIGLSVSLYMRTALIYVAAALAPIVFAADVLPLFRGSARKLVHLLVALVLSKLVIVVTLVVAVKLIANPTDGTTEASVVNEGAAAVGTLITGFVCFLIAAVSPWVLYRLLPTVEGAAVATGVAGGWSRGITTAAHTAVTVKSLGAAKGASVATRPIAGEAGATAQPGRITGFASTAAASSPPGGEQPSRRRHPTPSSSAPTSRGRTGEASESQSEPVA